ncbi:chromosome complete related protein, putative [Babesia ovis]|uniref:Chromosome complete related protein, putative n=1 Tax=Babesia ovis TaxID=5869 RepID=A0A9W5T867_BABOV|nr:chromosome complete related protein, putative [Babesia ovis]
MWNPQGRALNRILPTHLTVNLGNAGYNRSIRCISTNCVDIPIHYQTPRELLRTVVRGANTKKGNRNFWKRCANAVIYHTECYNSAELVQIANAFSRVNHHDSALCKHIAQRVLELEESWRIGDLPVLLNAFRALGVYHETLFEKAVAKVVQNVHFVNPEGVALTINSLSVAGVKQKTHLDSLVVPIFKSISQFSTHNLYTIIKTLAVLQYRNVSLLQLIAHHVAEANINSPISFGLIKAYHDLNYVDDNVVKIAEQFMSSNGHFINLDELPTIVKVFVAIHQTKKIGPHVFQAICRNVTRNRNDPSWQTIFGVKYAMDAVNHQDVYLDQMCNQLRNKCIHELSTQAKIDLLRASNGFPLPLDHLYDTILSSIEKRHGGTTIINENITVEEFIQLVILFSQLGYISGIGTCLQSVTKYSHDLNSVTAIKCHEMLGRYYKHLIVASKKATEPGKNVYEGGMTTTRSMDNSNQPDVFQANTKIKSVVSHVIDINTYLEHVNDDQIAAMVNCWKYLEDMVHKASPQDCALGICHAELNSGYISMLAKKIISMDKCDIDAEIIPAMLKKTIVASQKQGPLPSICKALQEYGIKLLMDNGAVSMLSFRSFETLVHVCNQANIRGSNKILPIMIQCFINNSLEFAEETIITPRFSNTALGLLHGCRLHPDVDHIPLSRYLCISVQKIQSSRLNELLHLLIQLGFREKTYITMLEPAIDDTIMIDSDMTRVAQLEECANALGLKLNTVTYSNP